MAKYGHEASEQMTERLETKFSSRGSEVVAVENENWDYCYSNWMFSA